MFRHLGRFALLALCLFAITIVMGCGGSSGWWNGEEEEEVELTPMQKLTGTYSLVEFESIQDNEVDEPPNSGKLHLRPEGNGWLLTLEYEDLEDYGGAGPTWTANDTTITFTASDGTRWSEDYTLEGKLLTLSFFDEDDEYARLEKWRKID